MVDRIDIETPYSPGWWLNRLLIELHGKRTGRRGSQRWTRDQVASSKVPAPLDLLNDYFRGDPPLRSDVHAGWGAPFRAFLRMGRLHVADNLVAATGNRMGIRDFRTAAAGDELGDEVARDLMRRNGLKLVARDVHDNMLGLRDGYALVTPPDDTRDWSLVTSQSPLQCITAHDPATGRALAGIIVFADEDLDGEWVHLFIPGPEGGMYVAFCEGVSGLGRRGPFRFVANQWRWEADLFDDIPGGRMPIVRFRNRRGISEFEHHLNHLDRINDKLFNEWWIEKIQAFRQRALERDKDVEEPDEDDDDAVNALDASRVEDTLSKLLVSGPDALWDLPPGVKIWESANVDVNPLLNSIQKELQWLAVVTRKPIASLNPDAANQSAEGSSNQKEDHLYEVEDRRDRAEAGWAEVMSLAFFFQDDTERADVTKIEPIWAPIERFSLQQRADAGSKAKGILPIEAIQRDIWQYSPAEIPQLREMRGNDLYYDTNGV